ncbi:hypothetical protein [Paucibacter soli]|uniref:hypothetical protein n=1 Tax=Paucibacter soli TaxID=3133433 RepID=UPI0030A748C9
MSLLARAQLSLLILLAPAAAYASCGLQQLGLALQQAESRWAEFDDAQGRRLLSERGRLPGAALELRAACTEGWPALELRAQRGKGERAYQGQSNQGQALATTAELRDTRLQAQLWQRVAPALELGLLSEWQQIHRELADAGAVRGYPERHRRYRLGLGLRLHGELSPAWQYMLQGEWAVGPAGRLHLELPIADPVDLPSGRLQRQLGLQLQLQWSIPDAPAWQLGAGLGWRQEQLSEGELATLWRAGNAVGGVRQPSTRTQEWVPELALLYVF